MGGVVVDLVEVVAEPQREGGRIGIDVGAEIECAKLDVGSAVELFDLAVSGRVPPGAVDEGPFEILDDVVGVEGDESWTAIEVERVHEPVATDQLVQALEEELGRLRGPDPDEEPEPGRVVEDEQRHAPSSSRSRPEVVAVGQHHLHAMGVGESTLVPVGGLRTTVANGKAHAAGGAVGGGAVDARDRVDDAARLGAAKDLRDRGGGLLLLLRAEKVHELGGEHRRGRDPGATCGAESVEAVLRERREPAIERAPADRTGPTVEGDVLERGDGAHCLGTGNPTRHPRPDVADERVAKQRLGIGIVRHGRARELARG